MNSQRSTKVAADGIPAADDCHCGGQWSAAHPLTGRVQRDVQMSSPGRNERQLSLVTHVDRCQTMPQRIERHELVDFPLNCPAEISRDPASGPAGNSINTWSLGLFHGATITRLPFRATA